MRLACVWSAETRKTGFDVSVEHTTTSIRNQSIYICTYSIVSPHPSSPWRPFLEWSPPPCVCVIETNAYIRFNVSRSITVITRFRSPTIVSRYVKFARTYFLKSLTAVSLKTYNLSLARRSKYLHTGLAAPISNQRKTVIELCLVPTDPLPNRRQWRFGALGLNYIDFSLDINGFGLW